MMFTCAASTQVTATQVRKFSVSSVLHWGVKAWLCLQDSRKTEICDHVSIKLDDITSFQLSNIHVSLPSHTANESTNYKRYKQLKLEYSKYLKTTIITHEFMEATFLVKDLCVCVFANVLPKSLKLHNNDYNTDKKETQSGLQDTK